MPRYGRITIELVVAGRYLLSWICLHLRINTKIKSKFYPNKGIVVRISNVDSVEQGVGAGVGWGWWGVCVCVYGGGVYHNWNSAATGILLVLHNLCIYIYIYWK